MVYQVPELGGMSGLCFRADTYDVVRFSPGLFSVLYLFISSLFLLTIIILFKVRWEVVFYGKKKCYVIGQKFSIEGIDYKRVLGGGAGAA